MSEALLDMKGTTCPIPVLRADRALRSMAPGERLRVFATDRASLERVERRTAALLE